MRTDTLKEEDFPFWAIKKHQDEVEIVMFDRMEERWGEKRFLYTKKLFINEYSKYWRVDDNLNDGIGFGLNHHKMMRYHLPESDKGRKAIQFLIKRIFER